MVIRKIFIVISLALFLTGCGTKTKLLENGISRVPANNKVFKNRNYFDPALLKVIDTAALYVQENPRTDRYNAYYRFYGNGNVSLFHFYGGHSIKPQELDPAKSGSRGVYYTKNGKIYIDLFTIVGYGFNAIYGVSQKILNADDGRITLFDGKGDEYPDVFVKRDLPVDALDYKADW